MGICIRNGLRGERLAAALDAKEKHAARRLQTVLASVGGEGQGPLLHPGLEALQPAQLLRPLGRVLSLPVALVLLIDTSSSMEDRMALAQEAAKLTAAKKLLSVAGGGDTVAALEAAGVADQFTYISTAGGAFLEWMEGKTLPGVAALIRAA